MDYRRAACICLIPFYLFSLFVFFSSSSPTPSHQHPPPPHLQHTFALPSFNFSHPPLLSSSSLFSSLLLPREKRFCLLLVSAPSQSAFLISSYCFCLIFKCYPGPNGNPYRGEKKKERGVSGERERRKEKPAGYCVSLQDPETKAPPPPHHPPSGKDLEGTGGRRGEESRGWRMGLSSNPKG